MNRRTVFSARVPWVHVTPLLSLLLLAANAEAADRETPLFRDPTQSVEKRVEDLISRLTLDEKATLLNHRGPEVERFGIKSDKWNQCLHGVWWDRPTTMFPVSIALAATWDSPLAHQVATAISDEARGIYNGWHQDPKFPGEKKGLIYRAPVINISRNPYWGRINECYGEDPYLTGRIGVAYVRGLQGDDPRYLKLVSTLKHYAVNNVEKDRQKLSATVSERMLHEYWLPHFRDCIVEGRAQSVMASYNAINGVPNNINHLLLTDILKDKWGFSGFVVSDLGGVRTMVRGHAGGKMTFEDAVARSLNAGCDFSDKEFMEHIPVAVRNGLLPESRLNDALYRVLRARFRLGEFDPPELVPFSKISPNVICCREHRRLSLETARKSIVLLSNRGHFLPLDKTQLKTIAVIGPHAGMFAAGGYSGKAIDPVTPLQGIRNSMAPGTEVLHAKGCEITIGGITSVDREDGFSGGASVKLNADAAGAYVEFTVDVPAPGAYEIHLRYKTFPSRGIYQLSINGEDPGSAIDMYSATAHYDNQIVVGKKRFRKAGVSQFRFTAIGKNPQSNSFTGHFDRISLGTALRYETERLTYVSHTGGRRDAISQAAELARQADVAIVYVGTTLAVEAEGRDRTTLALPGNQEALIKAVVTANPRTVVVLLNAGPLAIPWVKENVPAMLEAWWCGEEGGNAIADVIFGDVNPGGRLPYTVYESDDQVPPQDEYDISQGFTYMYLKGEPLFPFGHGLSYTDFRYSNLRLSAEQISPDGTVTVSVDVQNSGSRAGDEVVQLYVRDVQCSVKRPSKELRGFQRIRLQPDETKTVTFSLPANKLAFYDESTHRFVVEPGVFDILVGSSSADTRLMGQLEIKDAAR
ncbi:MAG: glycoside hydrolase family 3 C-terminal domain-containing protein [Planctomycetes bacterium]|nr:glycoside hydrolase family 3 C-terminal domain-containing protein [Planctomycetota bacterium]MBL7038010.1 glycoside hydrolase family 3 C-terminal domain-containing protein [Pirellulaceae bacterium]